MKHASFSTLAPDPSFQYRPRRSRSQKIRLFCSLTPYPTKHLFIFRANTNLILFIFLSISLVGSFACFSLHLFVKNILGCYVMFHYVSECSTFRQMLSPYVAQTYGDFRPCYQGALKLHRLVFFALHATPLLICIVNWTSFFIVNCIVTAAPNHLNNNCEH